MPSAGSLFALPQKPKGVAVKAPLGKLGLGLGLLRWWLLHSHS